MQEKERNAAKKYRLLTHPLFTNRWMYFVFKCDRHIKETKESRLPIVTGFAAKAVLFSYYIFRTFTLIQHFYDFIISS